METQLPLPKRGRGGAPQFSALICCGQMAGWIKMPLGRKVGLSRSNIVLDGDPAPLPQKGTEPPNFRPMSIVARRLHGIDATWRGGRSRPRPHCARCGPSSPPQNRGRAHPQFSAHFYCGQTAVCIRIPLGTAVCLSLGDIVLDGNTASPPVKVHSPPHFGQRPLWPNGWMD